MNLTVWLDIGVSILFILTVIVCYRRGFAKTILGLLSSVISLAGAYFIGSWLSKLIYDNAIKDKIVSGVSNSISVIIEPSFFLHLLDGHSITQNGRWMPETVDYREIYQKVPKRIDRWRLVRLLKKRARRLKKNP